MENTHLKGRIVLKLAQTKQGVILLHGLNSSRSGECPLADSGMGHSDLIKSRMFLDQLGDYQQTEGPAARTD